MTNSAIETDYLVIGAGAAAMAIADALLTHTDATVTIVDRRHAPGGHWIDAYPMCACISLRLSMAWTRLPWVRVPSTPPV